MTEILHHTNEVYEKTGRVDVTKQKDNKNQIQRDLVLFNDGACIRYDEGAWQTVAGSDPITENLRMHGERILSQDISQGETNIKYDAVTRERLKDLGYI